MTALPPGQPSARLGPAFDRLYAQINALQQRIDRLERGQRAAQLANSSVENGAILFNDADGELQLSAGLQPDGTHAVAYLGNGNPDASDDPSVVAGIKSLFVTWDGLMGDGSLPTADNSGVQVHVSLDDGFVPGPATYQGTLHAPGTFQAGGLLAFSTYYVALVTVNQAGNTGPPSDYIAGTPQSIPQNIPPGSLTGHMIGNQTITGDNIAADTITAVNVVAGILDGSVVEGVTIIVSGDPSTGGVLLVYSGAPAAGNLAESIAPVAGADEYGNAYLTGFTSYTTSGGGRIAAQNTLAGLIFSTAPGYGGPYTAVASVSLDTSGALDIGCQLGILNPGNFQFNADGLVTYGSLGTWQNLSGATGWVASGAQYQLLPVGNGAVAFRGTIVTPSSGGYNGIAATTALPSACQPGVARRWPVVNTTAATVTGYAVLTTGGVIEFQNLPGSYNSSDVEINGVVWL